MTPQLPAGPAARSALYLLGLLAALKALSLVLMGQAIAAVLAGLMAPGLLAAGTGVPGQPAWPGGWSGDGSLAWGLAGVVLRSLTVWAQGVASRRAALGVKEDLRFRLLERALRDGNRAVGPSDGGLAVLATRGLDALDSYYTQFLPALVNCAAIPLLLGARILFADWISAVVVVLTMPLVPLFMVLIGRYTEDRVREAQSALSRLSCHMLELAKGLPVLVGLGRASAQRKALEDISEEYRVRTMGTLRTAFLSALALELIATISVAVVAVFIGVRLVHGEMALEAALLALILAPDCYLPLRELGTAHHASDDGKAALADTAAVLDAPEPQMLEPAAVQDAGITPAARPPAVVVDALAVRYRGRSDAAVGPLSFTAAPGRLTALDGASGAGKSTVLGVLAGTVGTGDGTTVSGRLEGFARADIAWVPQHPVMLAPTVLEEIRLYLGLGLGLGDAGTATGNREDATARRCLAACAAGHLAAKHPAELSPGELRRVALARGLARIEAGATVLLLDEPTAHLDPGSAAAVTRAILGLRGRATVLLVAHDRATRDLADALVPVAASPALKPAGLPPAVRRSGRVLGDRLPGHVLGDRLPGPMLGERRPGHGLGWRAQGQGEAAFPVGAAAGIPAVVDHGAGKTLPYTRGEGAAGNRAGSTAGHLGRLLAPVAAKFAAAGTVATLAALFAVALAGLSGWLIIRASEQPPILYLLGAIVGVRFFGVGRASLRYAERLLLHDAVFAALTRLRGRLWGSLSRRALSLRRLLQGGNVLGSVVDDVDTVRELLPRVVLPPLTGVAVAVAAVAGIGVLLPTALPAVAAAALISLAAAPALALAADAMSARTEQRLRAGVLRKVVAALGARAELHANGVSAAVLASIARADRAATAASQRSAWAEGLGQGLTVLACGSAALASAVLAAPLVLDGAVEPAVVAVIVLLQLALVEPYGAITTAVRQYPALRAVLRRISAAGVLDRGPEGGAKCGPAPASDGLVPVAVRRGDAPGIELVELAAAWPGGGTVFAGLCASAAPGRWLSVTGASGSGKSTLLAVVLGFLPAANGAVLLTGRAAWCPQEAHLFDSTIRGNLMLGLPPAPADAEAVSAGGCGAEAQDVGHGKPRAGEEARMRDALAAVGLAPLLAGLEDGLDTRIGPGGTFLSGGERQRLAIARTLMTGAEVILLDEPTAHLDAESSRALLAELRHGLRHRTVVLVTHNPEDIAPEDDRLDLDQGVDLDQCLDLGQGGDLDQDAGTPPLLARA